MKSKLVQNAANDLSYINCPEPVRCQLVVHIADRYMSSSEVLHILVASLAMVGSVSKKDLQVIHYLRKNKLLSIDIDVLCKDSMTTVNAMGESVADSLSPLHLLPELRHLYRRAVFHVLARRRLYGIDHTIKMSTRELPDATSHTRRNTSVNICSIVKLPNIAIESEIAGRVCGVEKGSNFKAANHLVSNDDNSRQVDNLRNLKDLRVSGLAVCSPVLDFDEVELFPESSKMPALRPIEHVDSDALVYLSEASLPADNVVNEELNSRVTTIGSIGLLKDPLSNHTDKQSPAPHAVSSSTEKSSVDVSGNSAYHGFDNVISDSDDFVPVKLVLKKAKDIWDDDT